MKKLSIIFTLFCFTIFAYSQPVYDYLKAADDYYKKGDYYSAAQYYEKYLGIGKSKIKGNEFDPYAAASLTKQQKAAVSNKQQAIYKLAESYRLLNFHTKSEPYYLQASVFSKTDFPVASYWYGKTLKALGKYDAADSVLNSFLATYSSADNYKSDAERESKNLKFIQSQLLKKDLYLYSVEKANNNLNTKGANYAPMWMDADKLMFTSTRLDSTQPKNKQYINHVFVANLNGGKVDSIKKMNIPQPVDIHQGVTSMTPDKQTMFLSRWSLVKGNKIAQLYVSKKVSTEVWGEPKLLDTLYNYPGFSTQQPFVMPDGKNLLFSSNRPGGVGGFDLWYVAIDNTGNPLDLPVNMGNSINSVYDEQAPYYHASSNTLIFSSNGNIGMGGFDFFKSKGNIGSWSVPENFGYPLNSIKDDIYIVATGGPKNILENIIFSSDRSSECCLDLFYLAKKRLLKQISGTVVDCDSKTPIIGAKVEVINSNNSLVHTQVTGIDGTYAFTMTDFENLTTNASVKGFKSATISSEAIADDEIETQILPVLCLQKIIDTIPPPPKVDTIVVMNNIYFNFNEATILPESFNYIDAEIVAMMNRYPTMVIEISGHTDNIGKDNYNLNLSERRANAVKDYLASKGITPARMETKGFGELNPVAPNKLPNGKDNPEGRAKNRRIEFKVLRYL
jgi:outer membrane protein OmpA-like peptidoglycan-associated protein